MTYGEICRRTRRLFDATATARGALRALTVAVASLELPPSAPRSRRGRIRHRHRPRGLPRPKGRPLRTAYETVKRLVTETAAGRRTLDDLTLEDLRGYHALFDEEALGAISVTRALAARDVPGGTAPSARRRCPSTPPRSVPPRPAPPGPPSPSSPAQSRGAAFTASPDDHFIL